MQANPYGRPTKNNHFLFTNLLKPLLSNYKFTCTNPFPHCCDVYFIQNVYFNVVIRDAFRSLVIMKFGSWINGWEKPRMLNVISCIEIHFEII